MVLRVGSGLRCSRIAASSASLGQVAVTEAIRKPRSAAAPSKDRATDQASGLFEALASISMRMRLSRLSRRKDCLISCGRTSANASRDPAKPPAGAF